MITDNDLLKLEDIGFYTLSDDRARNSSISSNMWRCELLITDRCNFRCPYCRGMKETQKGDISLEDSKKIMDIWAKDGLKNIRFSGGEPTIHPNLKEMIKYAKFKQIERIAISTNGYADLKYYLKLIAAGVNDFSISLDACCSEFGKEMCGGIDNAWDKVVSNIKKLSVLSYVTLGMVFTDETIANASDVITFGHSLGVDDIRIVSSAQYNNTIDGLHKISNDILDAHPILKYRVNHYLNNRNVRGLKSSDNNRCPLAIDDGVVVAGQHYPCIIHLREGGAPIGEVSPQMRNERIEWSKNHNTQSDKICRDNCLDVCIDYNNKWREYHGY